MNHPISLRTRLLCPFFFNGEEIDSAISCLLGLRQPHKDPDKEDHIVWETVSGVPEFYKQEFLQTGQRFLFPQGEYLQVSNGRLSSWFRNKIKVSVSTKKEDFYVRLSKVELFISPFGVGILSIGLEVILPDEKTISSINDYKHYNYHLSQLDILKKAPQFSLPISLNNPNHDQLTNNVALNGDSIDRQLGVDGCSFYLRQLCDYLLVEPLQELGFKSVQHQFSVYSVIAFDKNVDFSLESIRDEMRVFLSGMAQVEEPNHAGHLPSVEMSITNQIMNTRHWVAMSFLGTAHLVADQGTDYDQQRVNIIFDKYFIPYLASFYQRLILQRLLDNASLTVYEKMSADDCAKQFCNINTQLLDFTVTGLFTEISSREALNQYYRLGQQAFSISTNIERVSSAIHNYDANQITKNLSDNVNSISEMQKSVDKNINHISKMQESVDKNINQISKMQGSVEWFQVLFVIGATAQLTEYIGVMSGPGEYAKWSTFLAPIVTGIASLGILRPWKNDPDFGKNKKKFWIMGGVIAVAFLCWWGYAFSQGKDKLKTGSASSKMEQSHATTVVKPAPK